MSYIKEEDLLNTLVEDLVVYLANQIVYTLDTEGFGSAWYFTRDAIKAIIEKMPKSDIVEFVRCESCMHREGLPGQPNIVCYQVHDEDFCSSGE